MSVENKIKELANDLSFQDRSAVAFGFPTELDTELYLQESADPEVIPMDDFDGEESRTSVNGDWKPINDTSDFDGYDFVDEDDFDNFLTKKQEQEIRKKGRLKKLISLKDYRVKMLVKKQRLML